MLPVARRRTPLHARYLCPRGHADPNMSPCHAGGLEPSSTSCKTSRCVFHFVDYIFPSHTISFNTQQAVTNWQRRVHIHARRVYELHSPLHLHIEVARVRVTMEETQCNAPLVTCRLGAASGCAVKCQSSSTVDFGRLCELRRTFVGGPFRKRKRNRQPQTGRESDVRSLSLYCEPWPMGLHCSMGKRNTDRISVSAPNTLECPSRSLVALFQLK